jgi:hypothetical protein
VKLPFVTLLREVQQLEQRLAGATLPARQAVQPRVSGLLNRDAAPPWFASIQRVISFAIGGRLVLCGFASWLGANLFDLATIEREICAVSFDNGKLVLHGVGTAGAEEQYETGR